MQMLHNLDVYAETTMGIATRDLLVRYFYRKPVVPAPAGPVDGALIG